MGVITGTDNDGIKFGRTDDPEQAANLRNIDTLRCLNSTASGDVICNDLLVRRGFRAFTEFVEYSGATHRFTAEQVMGGRALRHTNVDGIDFLPSSVELLSLIPLSVLGASFTFVYSLGEEAFPHAMELKGVLDSVLLNEGHLFISAGQTMTLTFVLTNTDVGGEQFTVYRNYTENREAVLCRVADTFAGSELIQAAHWGGPTGQVVPSIVIGRPGVIRYVSVAYVGENALAIDGTDTASVEFDIGYVSENTGLFTEFSNPFTGLGTVSWLPDMNGTHPAVTSSYLGFAFSLSTKISVRSRIVESVPGTGVVAVANIMVLYDTY